MILSLPPFKLSCPSSLELHIFKAHVSTMTLTEIPVLTNLVQLRVFFNQPRMNSLLTHKNLPVTLLWVFLSVLYLSQVFLLQA